MSNKYHFSNNTNSYEILKPNTSKHIHAPKKSYFKAFIFLQKKNSKT